MWKLYYRKLLYLLKIHHSVDVESVDFDNTLFRFLSLYIFTGFFITLCFVTTKKVRGLLREKFSKRRNEVVEGQASSSRDHRTGFTNVERASGSSPVTSRRAMQNFAYGVSCVWIHPFSFTSERNSLALVEESKTILVLGKWRYYDLLDLMTIEIKDLATNGCFVEQRNRGTVWADLS